MDKPIPEQFGFTKETFDAFQSKQKWFDGLFQVIAIIVSIVIWLFLAIIYVESTRHPAFYVFFFIFVIGLYAGIFIYHLAKHIHQTITYGSDEYKKYSQYSTALKNYESWKLEQERLQSEKERREQYEALQKRRKQADYWKSLSGTEFEKELSKVYKKLGYAVSLTPTTGDKGVDIKLEKDGKRSIVQCKAHKNPVGVAAARELYGTLLHLNYDEAILASVSGFTSGATAFAKDKPLILISTEHILEMQEQMSLKN